MSNAIDDGWLTGPAVDRRYGISAMTRWRWLRDPSLSFPSPIRVRARNYWRLEDIVEWERRQAAASAAKASIESGEAATKLSYGQGR